MKIKKLIAFLLVLATCVTLLPTLAVSAETPAFPVMPDIKASEKTQTTHYAYEDFSDTTYHGRVTVNAGEGKLVVENGALVVKVFDTGVYTSVNPFDVSGKVAAESKTDFTLAYDVYVTNPYGGDLLKASMRDSVSNSNKLLSVFTLSSNKVKVGDVDTGYTFPKNEWVLVEAAFIYDAAKQVYTAIQCKLNGTVVGTYNLTTGTEKYTVVNVLDTFRYMRVGAMQDNIRLVLGSKSVAYYFPPALPALPAVADSDRTEPDYLFYQNFSGAVNLAAGQTAANGGFWLNATADTHAVENGVLHAKKFAFVDLQLSGVPGYAFKEDFTLSFNYKPLATVGVSLMTFRYTVDNTYDWAADDIGINSNGKLRVNGTETPYVIPNNQWTLIEVAFHYNPDTGLFDEYTVMLNGTAVASCKTMSNAAQLSEVKHFRMFRWANGEFMLDNLIITRGDTSMAYAISPENADLTYQLHENFSDAPNTTNNQAAIKAAGGFRIAPGSAQYTVENGVLSMTDAVDGGYYIDANNYIANKSFNLSLRIKPQAAGFNGYLINEIIGSVGGTINRTNKNVVAINNGNLKIGDVRSSFALPVGEWTLIDVVFHYNTSTNTYDVITVSANGLVIGHTALGTALDSISILRTFNALGTTAYELDDMCLTEGTTSMAYANGDVELVAWQESAVNTETNTKDLRLLCNIESLEWKNYALDITVNGTALETVTGTMVYSSVLGYDETTKTQKTYTAEELGATNLIAIVLKNISVEQNYTIEIKPYVVSDGCLAEYYGDTITVTVTAGVVTVA